jgi:hypothetical protein
VELIGLILLVGLASVYQVFVSFAEAWGLDRFLGA